MSYTLKFSIVSDAPYSSDEKEKILTYFAEFMEDYDSDADMESATLNVIDNDAPIETENLDDKVEDAIKILSRAATVSLSVKFHDVPELADDHELEIEG